MHHREWASGKPSNTARLLALAAGVPVYIFGSRADETALVAELEKRSSKAPGRVFVLFPSKNSITVSEAINRANTRRPSLPVSPDNGVSTGAAVRGSGVHGGMDAPYTIVIVDGTWSNAKTILKALPLERLGIQPIRLARSTRERHGNMRRHAVDSRVSTLSAVCYLLEELGERRGAVDALSRLLHLAIQRYYEQTPKPKQLQFAMGTGAEHASVAKSMRVNG
jgi:DTW domain-containing protein YfiP